MDEFPAKTKQTWLVLSVFLLTFRSALLIRVRLRVVRIHFFLLFFPYSADDGTKLSRVNVIRNIPAERRSLFIRRMECILTHFKCLPRFRKQLIHYLRYGGSDSKIASPNFRRISVMLWICLINRNHWHKRLLNINNNDFTSEKFCRNIILLLIHDMLIHQPLLVVYNKYINV